MNHHLAMRDLDERVFRFSCRIVDLFNNLHKGCAAGKAIAPQLLRAGTSVGANYQEAAAGQTKADFIAKLSVARKESRETLYWLRLIEAKHLLDAGDIGRDISEARQITAILTAIISKAKQSPHRGPGR